jgi:hypothetical protein
MKHLASDRVKKKLVFLESGGAAGGPSDRSAAGNPLRYRCVIWPGRTMWIVAAKEKSRSASAAEAVRVRRLREDARRPLSVNLAEGIALSHMLMRFAGAARGR